MISSTPPPATPPLLPLCSAAYAVSEEGWFVSRNTVHKILHPFYVAFAFILFNQGATLADETDITMACKNSNRAEEWNR